jgi:DNA-binding MarR family transcriptional regulator
MKPQLDDLAALREHRNSRLYRSLTRTLRSYNRLLIDGLHARGFTDFSPAFPQVLSNLDTEGTRIGVLAARAGVSRQAMGQLVAEIERSGYVRRSAAKEDARASVVRFTPRGKRLLENVLELVEQIEGDFSAVIGAKAFAAVRAGLGCIAAAIDPEGAFGSTGDETPDS